MDRHVPNRFRIGIPSCAIWPGSRARNRRWRLRSSTKSRTGGLPSNWISVQYAADLFVRVQRNRFCFPELIKILQKRLLKRKFLLSSYLFLLSCNQLLPRLSLRRYFVHHLGNRHVILVLNQNSPG